MEEMPTTEKLQDNIIEMAKGASTTEMIDHVSHCEICQRVLTDARHFTDWHRELMEKLT